VDLGMRGWGVLVTGASGGIGGATARMLAGEGVRVACHYRGNQAAAEELATDVGGIAVGADLTDPEQAEAMVATAWQRLGRLDAVVANAGVWPEQDVPLWELDVDRWRATIEANLTATFLTCRAFLRAVAAAPGDQVPPHPTIVLVASTAGAFGEAGHADYAAAKAAIAVGLARSLKNEVTALHPFARVNVVSPGWTVSPMTAATLDDALVDRVTATMPLRKVATVDDVAAAITTLLSPVTAGHLTGEVVTVAGGMEGRLLHP
jgi:3-oxoacyl-[acyl-carrier protein] reductase